MMRKFVVVSLLLLAGCVHNPPVPPDPTPFPDRYVRFTVRGESGHTPPSTEAFINDDFEHVFPCTFDGDRANCKLDASIPQGDPTHPENVLLGGHVTIISPRYDDFRDDFGFNGLSQDLEDVLLELTFHPLTAIRPEGHHFRLVDGGRFTWIGATDFNIFARFLAGEDIVPILDQRVSAGFNGLRVFTAYRVSTIGNLHPGMYPDYYEQLPIFLDKLAGKGLRVEVVAFTGPYATFFPNPIDFKTHWDQLCAATQGKTNVTLEVVNEYNHEANDGVPFELIRPCPGVLVSQGSATADHEPAMPFRDYVTFHPGNTEFQRKAGHNAMEQWDGPTVSNEFSRSPDTDSNSIHWYDAGVNCALLAAGCTFHSFHGRNSILWEGIELENAKEFVKGMKSIDLELCQGRPYRRRDDLLEPGLLRVHQRGTDDRCLSKPRE